MTSNAFHRANLGAAAAIFLIGSGFLLFRAHTLAFTHDEALTWLHAIRPGLGRLFAFGYPNANNHLLNSLLAWGSSAAFGPSEWALRLPNVLAFGLFVFAATRLLARRARPALVIPGLLLVVCNPFQLDFFALCRGYGLALAFTLLALDAALASLEAPDRRALAVRRRDALKAGAFAALATLANLAWLNFAFALACVLGGLQLARNRDEPEAGPFLRGWVLPQLPTLLLLAGILTPVLLKLRAEQALYLGGETGFWSDTVGSLIEATLYAQPYTATLQAPLAVAAAILLLATAGVTLTGGLRSRPGSSREAALALLGILVVCIASSQIQHFALGTKFLIDRTALFLAPVFGLLVIFSCGALDASAAARRAGGIAAGTLAAITTLHTALALNTSHTLTWAYDADTRRMLDDLRVYVEARPAERRPVRLGAEWLHQPAVDYYRDRDALSWLAPMTRTGFAREHDFYFYREDSTDSAIERIPLESIHRYPRSGHVLARDWRGFE